MFGLVTAPLSSSSLSCHGCVVAAVTTVAALWHTHRSSSRTKINQFSSENLLMMDKHLKMSQPAGTPACWDAHDNVSVADREGEPAAAHAGAVELGERQPRQLLRLVDRLLGAAQVLLQAGLRSTNVLLQCRCSRLLQNQLGMSQAMMSRQSASSAVCKLHAATWSRSLLVRDGKYAVRWSLQSQTGLPAPAGGPAPAAARTQRGGRRRLHHRAPPPACRNMTIRSHSEITTKRQPSRGATV